MKSKIIFQWPVKFIKNSKEKKMEVKDYKWDKYDVKSIDFILNESEKLLYEVVKAFRETTNKCYYVLGIYMAILSYCVERIIDNGIYPPFIIMIIGMFICIVILFMTLMPGNLIFNGVRPRKLLISHFENLPKEEQILEYKIQTVVANGNAILLNKIKVKNRIFLFKISISVFLACIAIIFIWLLILYQSQMC